MSSEAKINANRTNAQKSTGPRTADGKSVSSQNARKHGLSGRLTLLTDEDKLLYSGLSERLINEMEPVTLTEEEHVKTISDCHWQLNILRALEQQILDELGAKEAAASSGDIDLVTARAVRKDLEGKGALEKLARYQTQYHRRLIQTTREFDRLKTARLAANRASIIFLFEQRTRSIFNPKKDRIGTPTGFDLQKSELHQHLLSIREPILKAQGLWEPPKTENGPHPAPQAA